MRERITCEDVEVGITEYLDDVLPGELHQRFTSHLGACPDCADHLQRIRWTIDHLRFLPRTSMPPGMKTSLIAAFRSHAPSQPDLRHARSSPDSWSEAYSSVAAPAAYASRCVFVRDLCPDRYEPSAKG